MNKKAEDDFARVVRLRREAMKNLPLCECCGKALVFPQVDICGSCRRDRESWERFWAVPLPPLDK